jgi:3-hydroxyacyl-CoA dehydrogenase
MKLLEVVKGAKSAPDTIATSMSLGKKIGKTTVLAGALQRKH